MDNKEVAHRLANMYFYSGKSDNFRAVKIFLDQTLDLCESPDKYSRALVEYHIKNKLDSNKVWRSLSDGKSPTW